MQEASEECARKEGEGRSEIHEVRRGITAEHILSVSLGGRFSVCKGCSSLRPSYRSSMSLTTCPLITATPR